MADPSAEAPRTSAARPATASTGFGRAAQRFAKNAYALVTRELREEGQGRVVLAFIIEHNGGLRFHFSGKDGAACSSSLASGQSDKHGSPSTARRPTASKAARTSTSTSTVSRRKRKRRNWQFRGIFRRIVSRSRTRLAFHKWKTAATDASDNEAPPATPPDIEMASLNIGTLPVAHSTPLPIVETAPPSTGTLSVASSTPKTYARAASAQTSPSTGSAHCSPTLSQKRPVAASTPGSTTSPHPSPSRSAKKKKKPTPPSPAKKGLRGPSKPG
jgi:hypothetical protein